MSISRSTATYLRNEYFWFIDDMVTNRLVSSLSGCPRQKTKRDSWPDEEEAGEGGVGGQDIPLAVPHQLHPAQHRVLGPVWWPRSLVMVHSGKLWSLSDDKHCTEGNLTSQREDPPHSPKVQYFSRGHRHSSAWCAKIWMVMIGDEPVFLDIVHYCTSHGSVLNSEQTIIQ